MAGTEAALPPNTAFVAASSARRVCLGGRPLLFSERGQQLFELNETADLIWRRLSAGDSAGAAVRALASGGLPAETAAVFVAEAARAWMAAGELLPRAVGAALAAPCALVREIALDELAVRLEFSDAAAAEACDAVFGHLYAPAGPAARRLAVVGHDGLFFLALDGEPIGAVAAESLAPRVKALLTELYAGVVSEGFLTHGALLARGEAALLLNGAPGAGKTTLAVALAGAGWAYGGDDIVRIGPDGLARGAPFAAAVKAGSWALAQPYAPGLDRLPVTLRADGRQVRYWRPARLAERTPRPLSAVVLLAREAGAAARLEPVEPVTALAALLESAWSARHRLDGDSLQALAERLGEARCARLVYSRLDEAVTLLGALAHVAA